MNCRRCALLLSVVAGVAPVSLQGAELTLPRLPWPAKYWCGVSPIPTAHRPFRLPVTWNFGNGWFVGGSAYRAVGSSVPELTRGRSLHLGWFRPVGRKRAVEVSVADYRFPGRFPDDWDYAEARVDWHWNDTLATTVAYADDYYGRGFDTLLTGFSWSPRIGTRAYARFDAATLRVLNGPDRWWAYGEFWLGISSGQLDAAAGIGVSDNSSDRALYSSRGETVAVRLTWLLL